MSYQTVPFRLFDRRQIYLDLKTKLLNNLILACKVAKKEGEAIIRKFGSLDAYFNTMERLNKQRCTKIQNIVNKKDKSFKIRGFERGAETQRDSVFGFSGSRESSPAPKSALVSAVRSVSGSPLKSN